MAKTSTVTLTIVVSGDGGSSTYAPPGTTITNPGAPDGGPHLFTLVAGPNTITPPSGAKGIVILPGGPVTLKGVAGDTGLLLFSGQPSYFSLGDGQGAFVLSAVIGTSVTIQWT